MDFHEFDLYQEPFVRQVVLLGKVCSAVELVVLVLGFGLYDPLHTSSYNKFVVLLDSLVARKTHPLIVDQDNFRNCSRLRPLLHQPRGSSRPMIVVPEMVRVRSKTKLQDRFLPRHPRTVKDQN